MVLKLASAAMGTRFELVLVGRDETRLRAAGEAALEEVEACDRRFSLFRRDSLVSRINREAQAGFVRVDPETFELLAACLEACRASEGAFDPCLGAAMRAHGFHGADSSARGASAAAGALELSSERSAVRFTRPGSALDLGGVAKGHALERAAEVLREAGVERALLHGGTSSAVALGAAPWRIGVAAPGSGAPAMAFDLADAAYAVSAAHGRTLPGAHAPRGHLLDPTGARAIAPGAVVCVQGASAREADLWSTALSVLFARSGDAAAALARLPAGLSAWIGWTDPTGLTWTSAGPRAELFDPLFRPDEKPDEKIA